MILQWLIVLFLVMLPLQGHTAEPSLSAPLFITDTGYAILPIQGFQQLQIVFTHATSCPDNVMNARPGNTCIDLDDKRVWQCNNSPLCSAPGHWINLSTPSVATHTPLSNATSINVTARYMFIEGSGGPVDINPGTTQIVAGSCNQEVTLFNSDITGVKTVKLDNGDGIRLPGNAGSVVVGRGRLAPTFRYACDISPNAWEQISGFTWQELFDQNNSLVIGACGSASALKLVNSAGTSSHELCIDAEQPIIKCTSSGLPCLNTTFGPLSIGGKVRVLNNAGTEIFAVNENGSVSGLSAGAAVVGGNQSDAATTCSGGGDTTYHFPFGRTARDISNEYSVIMRSPRAGTGAKLGVQFATSVPSGQTVTFTVRKELASTALACTIIGGAGVGDGEVAASGDTECNDATSTFSLSQGERLSVQVVCSGGVTALPAYTFAFAIE